MSFADIFEAAQKGTVEDVRYFIEQQGVDVNTKNDKGDSPLQSTIFNENGIEIAEFLVSIGANVNVRGINGYSPLHNAAMFNPKFTEFLISEGADVNAKSDSGETPLHWADSVEAAKYLVSAGVDLNAKDKLGYTPLHCAAGGFGRQNGVEVFKFLYEAGADVDAKDNSGFTPHRSAMLSGDNEICEYLSKTINDELSQIEAIVIEYEEKIKDGRYSAENSARQSLGISDFRTLAAKFNAGDKEWLEKYKAEIVRKNGSEDIDMLRFTTLDMDYPNNSRIKKLASRAAKCLLKLHEIQLAGGNLLGTPDARPQARIQNQEIMNNFINTYSRYILPEEDDDEISKPITKEKAVKMTFTDIFNAAKRGTVEDVRLFIEQKKVDVNAKDEYTCTPLHYAAKYNPNAKVVEYLISQGAEVDAKTWMNYTPLYEAALGGQAKAAEILISAGADINAETKGDYTPLHCCNNAETAKVLIAAGADANVTNCYGCTPLHVTAMLSGNVEVAEFLISEKANVNAKDNEGSTPLHLAAMNELIKIAEILIQAKADVNAIDNKGNTPFNIAQYYKQNLMVQFLEEPMRKVREANEQKRKEEQIRLYKEFTLKKAEEAKKRNIIIAVIVAIIIAVLAVFLLSSNNKDIVTKVPQEAQPKQPEAITFTDSRDNKTYKAIQIGNQVWMTENLNYKTGKSSCYNNNESKCNECGRLYDWATANKACPEGWRLPTNAEWTTLGNAIGTADKHGFSSSPCGRHFDGKFLHYGSLAFFWTATETDSKNAMASALDVNGANLDIGNLSKMYLRSVRCVKD